MTLNEMIYKRKSCRSFTGKSVYNNFVLFY